MVLPANAKVKGIGHYQESKITTFEANVQDLGLLNDTKGGSNC
jgi:hypothetical protein